MQKDPEFNTSETQNNIEFTAEEMLEEFPTQPPHAPPSLVAICYSALLAYGLYYNLHSTFAFNHAVFAGVIGFIACLGLIWHLHDGRINEAESKMDQLDADQITEKRTILEHTIVQLDDYGSKASLCCGAVFALFTIFASLPTEHKILGFVMAAISAVIISTLTTTFLKQLQINFYSHHTKHLAVHSYKDDIEDVSEDRYDFEEETKGQEKATPEEGEASDDRYEFNDEVKDLVEDESLVPPPPPIKEDTE